MFECRARLYHTVFTLNVNSYVYGKYRFVFLAACVVLTAVCDMFVCLFVCLRVCCGRVFITFPYYILPVLVTCV